MSAEQIREVNTRYHDVAADHYDAKWGIDFGDVGREQVLAKVEKALGHRPDGWARSLEIGSGTGYFTLNLLRAGLVSKATCSDISPGMLAALSANAERLELEVETALLDAEALPFADQSFELVFGHAVLHHIPNLDRAFAEFARVLAPGGTLLFAGEPSRYGDLIARVPKRAAGALAPLWRRAIGARAAPSSEQQEPDVALERFVDVHAFAPSDLARAAQSAGFTDVRITGEELLANWFGWTNRTLEASAIAQDVPQAWRQYAYRGYVILQQLDRRLLEPRLPPAIFYNLLICARRQSGAHA
jgi:ubiquinone/menaquinone biosynthesis C-methylase UbiE